MELLRAALALAVTAQGRLVMLGGEPGIGKTRLAQEFASHAAEQGTAVRWGRCWEGEGAPAFWPWIQVLRAQIAETEPDELQEQLGAGAGEMARLVPDLQARLPGMVARPLEDDAGARFRLFDSVGAFLKACAGCQPLALVFEDLHWADAASLELLRLLADGIQDSRLLLVGTYRDVEAVPPHPLAKVVGALAYHSVVQRVQLEGLSEEEVGALIESLGCERAASLAARIHRQSGGNPFFAAEIARAAGGARALPALVRGGGGVRDAIGNRLEKLSSECVELLRVASVIGPEFELGALERVSAGFSSALAPVMRLLSEAMEARIVDEVEEVVGGYRFAHALVREVLYTGLSLEKRLHLHWHIATALQELGVSEREHGAGTLAYHFLEAIPGRAEGEPRHQCIEKAVLYARKAAGQATATVAYEEAEAHYGRAVRALEAWAPHDTGRRYELLLAQGEAQGRAGTAHAIRAETYHRAAALARERAEPERLARAALSLAKWARPVEAASDAHVALLQEALGAVGPDDSSARAQLLGYLAVAKYFPDPRLHSAPLSAEALAMARRVGDARTLGTTLVNRYTVLTELEQTEERLGLAEELLTLGEQLGDKELAMQGRLHRLWERLGQGQIAALESELAQFVALANDLRQPLLQFRAVTMQAGLALLAGRFADAERLTFEARRLMPDRDDPLVSGPVLRVLYVTYREQDRLAEIETLFVGAAPLAAPLWGMSVVAADRHAEVGRLDEALAEIERVCRDDLGAMPRIRLWPSTMALLADLIEMFGNEKHAAIVYSVLLPYANRLVSDWLVLCLGSFSFPLGQLAGVMGRWDDALCYFDDALAAAVDIGSPLWAAYARCGAAKVLLARGRPGDPERARALLAEVSKTAQELGTRRLERRARALQEQVAGSVEVQTEADVPPLAKGVERGSSDRPVAQIPPGPLSSKEEGTRTATLRKEGEYWLIGYEGATFRLNNRVGLRHLAVLLKNPGREFLAIDLVAAVQGRRDKSGSEPGAERAVSGLAEPYFDEEARRAYTQRLQGLRAEMEEAEEFNDRERASRAKAEIDFITQEMGRGIGLSGRIRTSGSPVERARLSVTHAIKRTLQAITKNDARLGRYLAATVRTGTFCSYNPDPDAAVKWQF